VNVQGVAVAVVAVGGDGSPLWMRSGALAWTATVMKGAHEKSECFRRHKHLQHTSVRECLYECECVCVRLGMRVKAE